MGYHECTCNHRVTPLSFVEFKEEGFIGFYNTRKAFRLACFQAFKEAMTPTECRINAYTKKGCGLADRQPVMHVHLALSICLSK